MNADLDDYYDEYGDDVAESTGDPGKYLDNMLAQYKKRAQGSEADM